MVKVVVLSALLFFGFSSFAATTSHKLLFYRDCVKKPIEPVDITVTASGVEFEYSSNLFVSGLDISLIENTESGELVSVRFGQALEIPIHSFAAGVTFSAFDKILHTVEILTPMNNLRDQIPDEIVIRMGHLVDFDPVDLIRAKVLIDPALEHLNSVRKMGGRGVSQHMKAFYGERWREFTFSLNRTNNEASWEARNIHGSRFNELYTVLSVGLAGLVKGLEEIKTVEASPLMDHRARPVCFNPNLGRRSER